MSIAIKRNFTIPSTSAIGATELYLTSSVASTTIGTGALQVAGGAGISGVISLGGELKLFNGNFYTGFDSAATASTTYIWPATAPATGTSVLSSDSTGNLSWILMSASGSGLTLNDLTATTQYFSTSIAGNGFTISSIGSTHTFYIGLAGNASTGLISSTSQTIYGLKTFASGVAVTSGIASTNTTTGDLVVSGGVGVGGSLWTSTINFSSISGVGISNSVIISGVWSGTAISAIKGGTGIVSYTTGDILYASSSTTLGSITAGTAGSVLTSAGAGSTPYWAAATVGSATGLTLNGLTAATQFFATSISGSGFTIGSTGSTHTYYIALAGNASTGLISGAAQTIFGLKTFGSGIAVSSGTASTNTTTGALTVAGGVGITGQLSVNTIALGTTSVSITPSMIFTGTAGTVITMSVLSDTTLAWEGSSGQLFSIDNNLSSGEIFSVSDISGLPVITASAGQTITLNEFGGFTQVGNGLASTNTTTGALRVIGGVGVTGSLYLGSPLLIPSGGTGLTTYTTGDILYASSSTTLARITAGTAGSILTSAGSGTTPYWAASTGSTLAIAGTNNGDIQYKSAAALGASSALNFDASTSTFKLTGFPIEAVSSGSANVKLLGGSVSWSGNLNGTMLAINTANTFIGDLFNAQIGGTSRFKVSYTGAVSIGNSYTLPITDGTANQVFKTDGSGVVSWSDSVISSAQYNIGYYASAGTALTGSSTFTNNTSTEVVSIGHTTSSTGFSTGALVVTGGVGVGGSSHFNNTLHITSSIASTNTTTGALIVNGGAGIAGTLNIGGHIRTGTNTFSKSGMGEGDILLDNGTVDSPGILFYWGNNKNIGIDTFYSGSGTTKFRVVKELNESGGSEVWSVDRNGIVARTAWSPGETINTAMYNYSELGMAATTTINSTSYTTFATVTYTPKSSSSYLWIEFSCTYIVSGTTGDDFWSNIEVAGSEIVNSNQVWTGQVGGGTRSGVMFPLAARYTNSGTAGIAISIRSKRGTSDDSATIYGNAASGFMRVQEIGR